MTEISLRAKDSLTALGFTLVALALRLWHLSTPKGFVFDEVYYAKNAHSLVQHGVELKNSGAGEFIVHPPVGKWVILRHPMIISSVTESCDGCQQS